LNPLVSFSPWRLDPAVIDYRFDRSACILRARFALNDDRSGGLVLFSLQDAKYEMPLCDGRDGGSIGFCTSPTLLRLGVLDAGCICNKITLKEDASLLAMCSTGDYWTRNNGRSM
jgi:hypothetical protein